MILSPHSFIAEVGPELGAATKNFRSVRRGIVQVGFGHGSSTNKCNSWAE